MLSVGVDIVELDRVESVLERWGQRFLDRIYTPNEQTFSRRRIPQLAARFAAKEAVKKAFLSSDKVSVLPLDIIEIINDFAPEHLELLTTQPIEDLHLIRNAGAIFLGPNTGFTEQLIANMISKGLLLKYGRGAELEADKLAIEEMHAAGINPVGVINFFEKLAEKEKVNNSDVARLMSTHPPTNDRIKYAKKHIKYKYLEPDRNNGRKKKEFYFEDEDRKPIGMLIKRPQS